MPDSELITQAQYAEAQRMLAEPDAPQPLSAAASIMSVIAQAAGDPNTDVEKFERLMAMAERLQDREARAAFASALAELQPKLPVITERGGIKNNKDEVQSTYALWEDINEAIRPALAEHGFALSFRVGRSEGQVTVTGILSHRGGHAEETTMALPVDTSGNKNAVQAVGSSTSYGKRYTAMALLNITSRGEDDDGKKAGAGETVSEEQVAQLTAKIAEVKADLPKFLAVGKLERLEDMKASEFNGAMKLLEAKGKKAAKEPAQ